MYICNKQISLSFESIITAKVKQITDWINSLQEKSKSIDELPVQENLVETSKLHVSINGVSESLEVSKIRKNISHQNITGLSQELITVQNNAASYTNSVINIVPLGKLVRFKAPGNTDNDIWEEGDFGYGFTNDDYFLKPGVYQSGNPLLFSSWKGLVGDYINLQLTVGNGGGDS